MSYRAQDWAEHVTGIPWATKGVLLLLANRHNGETGQCNPSEEWLCQRTELEPRTIRMHLKVLEDAKLITRRYKHGGRGVGRSVDGFELHLGIQAAVKTPENDTLQDNEIATAESCHGKNASLPRQNIAKPYKEEPEENRKIIRGKASEALGVIWQAWSPEGRKRSKSKAKLSAQIAALAKRYDLQAIQSAALAFARETDPHYQPALDRWLAGEKFESWLPDPQASAPAEMTEAEWATAMRHWVDTGEWLASDASPAPDEPGCKAPAKMLRHAAKLRPDLAESLLANLKLGAAA